MNHGSKDIFHHRDSENTERERKQKAESRKRRGRAAKSARKEFGAGGDTESTESGQLRCEVIAHRRPKPHDQVSLGDVGRRCWPESTGTATAAASCMCFGASREGAPPPSTWEQAGATLVGKLQFTEGVEKRACNGAL